VSILGRKRWRDLRRQWAQVAAVALTIGLGLAGFVAARDAYLDLRGSLDHVYSQLRFADLTVTGGDPATITDGLQTLPGRPLTSTRVQTDVPLRIGPAKLLARVVSLPADGSQPPVDRLEVQTGALDTSGIAVEHHLAAHYGLRPGDRLTFATAGGWREYRVSAVVTSPQYLWPARSPQEILTDPAQFGVVFAAEPLVRQIAGASVVAQVAWYAQDRDQSAALVRAGQALAGRAGATEVTDRAHQGSARALSDDVNQMSDYAVLFPLLFLSAAALGAYILLSRLVAAQRVVIGTLRACGVPAGRLRRHYLGYGLAAGAGGAVLGVALGVPLGVFFAGSYADALGLPFHVTSLHPATVGWAVLAGVAAAAAAAWLPARAAARLHPGEAMRPTPTLGAGRRSLAERLVPGGRLPARWAMVLRGPGRNPGRTLLTLAGVVLALSLVIVPVGLWDTLGSQLARQFTTVQREDLQLYAQPGTLTGLLTTVRADPAVTAAEPFARTDVTIAAAGRTHTTLLYAYQPSTSMHGFPTGLPARGLLVPATLRDTMHLRTGDPVTLTLPAAGSHTATVAGFVDEPMGAIAYTTLAQYADWTGTPTPQAAASAIALRLRDGTDRAALVTRYAQRPEVAAATDIRALQTSMTDAFSLYNTLVVLMGVIGAAMAGALLYTTASANITERYVELGSLRAAGMGAGMLARLAAAENLLLALAATIPGVLAGWLLARAFMAAYTNDQMRMSLHLRPLTLPVVAVLVLGVAAVAQLPALRGIRRTDIARVVRERSI
jgi:putative ABC transport system permease protein